VARVTRLAPVLGVLALLALAAPAGAATSPVVDFGQGRFPDVAVDSAGSAHVVWDAQTASDHRLFYCQVPKGGTACTSSKTFTPPVEAIGRSSYVFAPGGGRVLVASHRCCGPEENWLYTSTDGGATFDAGHAIGNHNWDQNAVLGPGEAISGVSQSVFQLAPLAGPKTTRTAELDAGFPVPTYGSVAVFNNSIPVFAHADGANTTFHRWTGAGDIHDEKTWVGPTALSPPGNEAKLAGGVQGVTLLYQLEASLGKRFWGARKFDGTSFGPVVHVTETGDPIFAALGADTGSGAFHAAWVDNRSPNELRWARSADGVEWSEPAAAIRGDAADRVFNTRVTGAPGGGAFVAWDENDDSGHARGMFLPAKGAEEPPSDTVDLGGQEISLFGPFGCVKKPAKITLRVTHKIKVKLSPKKKVKISKVTFSLGKTKVTDKKAAFKATFKTDALAAGKYPTKAVVVLVPLNGGKKKTKTLKGSAAVCD
jgi:hypothetical protein